MRDVSVWAVAYRTRCPPAAGTQIPVRLLVWHRVERFGVKRLFELTRAGDQRELAMPATPDTSLVASN